MRSTVGALIGSLAILGSAMANPQADSFANIYASVCLKHLSNLEVLRSQLKQIPELPPEKASMFLQGEAGNAWPVPDRQGIFVVALLKNKNTCSVFARQVDAEAAQQRFARLVEKAPVPLISRLAEDRRGQSEKNGTTRTLSYEWSVPQAPRKMLFMLTTATAGTAQVQALATASLAQ